ncbi:MAG TPA: D-aminoacylase [Verrucomicrobiales bacterium]|nr:D-aminoacylase [Verrucomicrobiales bacterium]
MKILPYFLLLVVCGMVFFFFRGPEHYDLLIRNARIADGTGAPLVKGSIAVRGDRIVAVGDVKGAAEIEIDARGTVAAPGFIDVHTHSEAIPELPDAENFVRMGVTTIVSGNCGTSEPLVSAFFDKIKAAGCAINVATLIGHNTVRRRAMHGYYDRPPTPDELQEMKAFVEQGMKDGAVGLSTGLIYLPGAFASSDEIVELAKVASAYGGIYASHMRAENVKIYDALDELLRVAREANIPAEVSHIKLTGPSAWGQADKVLAVLDKARAEGLRITQDAYSYTASSTGLSQLVPDDARANGAKALRASLRDPKKKAEILAAMKEMRERQGHRDYAYAVIARYPAEPSLNGMSIAEAAKLKRGSDSLEDQIEMVLDIQCRGGGTGVFHGINEADLQRFLQHPDTMIASDGGPRSGEATDASHPRSYGNNARVLARYVRELKTLTLPDAIRRMTSLPAKTFRLQNRGTLTPGAFADIVLFDPAKVNDPSTFKDPHHFAEGFSDVIVNGRPVLRAGSLTGIRSGGPLRAPSR